MLSHHLVLSCSGPLRKSQKFSLRRIVFHAPSTATGERGQNETRELNERAVTLTGYSTVCPYLRSSIYWFLTPAHAVLSVLFQSSDLDLWSTSLQWTFLIRWRNDAQNIDAFHLSFIIPSSLRSSNRLPVQERKYRNSASAHARTKNMHLVMVYQIFNIKMLHSLVFYRLFG